MTEGLAHDCSPQIQRKVYFLLMVDVLQVIRVMTSEVTGWTAATTSVVSWSDIVYIFSNLTSRVVPRYTVLPTAQMTLPRGKLRLLPPLTSRSFAQMQLYILGVVLVTVAIADTWYVGRLFQKGSIQKLWPVKLLRFLVAGVVTVLFASVSLRPPPAETRAASWLPVCLPYVTWCPSMNRFHTLELAPGSSFGVTRRYHMSARTKRVLPRRSSSGC